MHLGRRPSRLPRDLEAVHGIAPSSLEPRAAWRATVDQAIELGVDAVLLAGDVVDSRNHFMEAYGALHEGVVRLAQQNIDVVCVAGNHDVDTLPRLADELDNVRLLGRRGTWQSFVICREGEPLVRVIGWSFPKRHVESDPLDSIPASWRAGRYEDDAPDDLRTVGLLHCDLDGGSSSRYAPVASASLARMDMGVSAWFLGHVHAPSIQGGGRPLGYLGSLVGLDPGEMGARGPWLADSAASRWELQQIPMSPVRWESIEVEVHQCSDAEALLGAIGRGVHDLESRLSGEMEGTRVVGIRPLLLGTCPAPLAEIRRATELARALELNPEGVYYFVDRVLDRTRPPIDLDALAKQADPAGLIAQRLLDLEDGGAACSALVTEARPTLESVAQHGNFSHLGPACGGDEEIRQLLIRVAHQALDQLLSQESAVAPPVQNAEVQV